MLTIPLGRQSGHATIRWIEHRGAHGFKVYQLGELIGVVLLLASTAM